jgi:hypothetical protein
MPAFVNKTISFKHKDAIIKCLNIMLIVSLRIIMK